MAGLDHIFGRFQVLQGQLFTLHLEVRGYNSAVVLGRLTHFHIMPAVVLGRAEGFQPLVCGSLLVKGVLQLV